MILVGKFKRFLKGSNQSSSCSHTIGVHLCSAHQQFCHVCYKCRIDFARHASHACVNCILFLANKQP